MAVRNFHWNPIDDCVISETDGSGNTIATYHREPTNFGPLLSETRGGDEYFHHYDALGSTMLLTNATGTTTDTFNYDGWGNSTARTGATPTPYSWVGRWGYESGTPTGGFYVRARSYDPGIARWLSVDPLYSVTDGGPYTYVADRTSLLVDPSGLKWHKVPLAGDIWWSDASGDSLEDLATIVSGDPADWVCIWPVDPIDKWEFKVPWAYSYPSTRLPCAQADVSNIATSVDNTDFKSFNKRQLRLIVQRGEFDKYLQAMFQVGKNVLKQWKSGKDAARQIRERSEQGKTPITRAMFIGHGWVPNEHILTDMKKQHGFEAQDVTHAARPVSDNSRNTLDTAKQMIGPPRCWFARGARIYGASCFSSPKWTADWTEWITGNRSTAVGYDDQLGGWFENQGAAYVWFEPDTKTTFKELKGFEASNQWK